MPAAMSVTGCDFPVLLRDAPAGRGPSEEVPFVDFPRFRRRCAGLREVWPFASGPPLDLSREPLIPPSFFHTKGPHQLPQFFRLARRAVLLSAVALCSGAVAAGPWPASAAHAAPSAAVGDGGRYLVQFAPGKDVAAETAALRAQGIGVNRTFTKAVKGAAIEASPAQAAALLRSGRAAAVEPDHAVTVSEVQRNAPWGLDRIDQQALPLSGSYTPAPPAKASAYTSWTPESSHPTSISAAGSAPDGQPRLTAWDQATATAMARTWQE